MLGSHYMASEYLSGFRRPASGSHDKAARVELPR